MAEDFNLETDTSLKGTVSRIGQYVRGECAVCHEDDVLVYDTFEDETLMCATHSRVRSMENPRKETCDKCGDENAWRDPLTRLNQFFCAKCHADNGTVFQNRWANKARISTPLRMYNGEKQAKCDAANHGTECAGEIKYRSAMRMSLCNKHAGRVSSNPRNN